MYGLIKKWESLKLKAYKCPADVWTIGYGTTIYPDGSKVKKGDVCTKEQAEKYLIHHIEKEIKLPKSQLTKNQIDALTSLIYRAGQSSFDKSNLKKAILTKDKAGVFSHWDWITAKGKTISGLINRANDERKLFMDDMR